MPGVALQVNFKPMTNGERGLPKRPVDSAFVSHHGVRGDYNVYRHEEKNDDPDSALLLMPIETIKQLNSEGWPIKAGDLGENVTTSGIDYSAFKVGKIFSIGDVRFKISRACTPCENLYLLPYVGVSNGPEFLKIMLGRRGWYARILDEGWIKSGDKIIEA